MTISDYLVYKVVGNVQVNVGEMCVCICVCV